MKLYRVTDGALRREHGRARRMSRAQLERYLDQRFIGGCTYTEAAIDGDILPLVKAIRTRRDMTTLGSCQGHPHSRVNRIGYVSIGVRGLAAVWALRAALIRMEGACPQLSFHVTLAWHPDVIAAMYPAAHNWLVFELQIAALDDTSAVTADEYRELADAFRSSRG